MKAYKVELGKNLVAVFEMDYVEFKMKFEMSTRFVEWIISKHPEYKDCVTNTTFSKDLITAEFYSLGEPVIVDVD